MKNKKLNWFEPKVGKTEYEYVKKVIDLNYPNQGFFTKEFENKIIHYVII